MEWLQAYAWLISITLSFLTLLVWVFYAFLLHRDARQQRLPALFLHQANGHRLSSMCLLSNLGREIIHILGVMVVLRTDDGPFFKRIESRDQVTIQPGEHAGVQDIIKQGPLPSGYFLSLGTFEEIMEPQDEDVLFNEKAHPQPEEVKEVEIRVAAVHAAYNEPIGALRRFDVVKPDGEIRVYPATPSTEVLMNRRERRFVAQWVERWIFRRQPDEKDPA